MNWVHLACLTPRILLSSHHSELIKSKCETFWHPFGPFPNTNFNPELFLLDSSLFFLRASQAKGTPRLASLFYMTCGKGTNGVWGHKGWGSTAEQLYARNIMVSFQWKGKLPVHLLKVISHLKPKLPKRSIVFLRSTLGWKHWGSNLCLKVCSYLIMGKFLNFPTCRK